MNDEVKVTIPAPGEPQAIPEDIGTAQSQRWERLLALLADQDRVSVAEAAQVLGVSESTIRRDFDQMAEARLARRTHGGIVAAAVSYGLPFRYANSDARVQRIASGAVSLLSERFPGGFTVGINGGITTTAVAEELGRLAEARHGETSGGKNRLTVVSNALNIASALVLRPQIRIVSLGGVVRSHSYELTGPIATEAMSSLWLDCMILGFVGLDVTAGVTCNESDEAVVTRTMVEHSGTVIAVGTSDKVGVRSFARICGTRDIDVLVTDHGLDSDQRAMLKAAKVEVVAV